MITDYPGLAAKLVPHTISVSRDADGADRLKPGYLVRCTAGGRDLGYLWDGYEPTGAKVWFWKTTDDSANGERVTSHAAVQTLRDIANLASRAPIRSVVGRLGVVDAGRSGPLFHPNQKAFVDACEREQAAFDARTTAPTAKRPDPPQNIVWGTAPVEMNAADLTVKIREALGRHQR